MLLLLLCVLSLSIIAQNTYNPYIQPPSNFSSSANYSSYIGEYQAFLLNHKWQSQLSLISSKIELVSFPFTPNHSQSSNENKRILTVAQNTAFRNDHTNNINNKYWDLNSI
jgi:hypothetical protein